MNNFVGLSKIGLVRQRNEDRFSLMAIFVLLLMAWVVIAVVKLQVPML